jgi:mRNA-degrading endonuclease RelE of RelBE toxin-antitoxin system
MAKSKDRKAHRTKTKTTAPSPAVARPSATPKPYDVDMTETAIAVYKELSRKAKEAELRGEYTSSHITNFDMVKDVIKRVIPGDPLNRKYGLRGALSNIFRIHKGRMRICWIASSKMQRVLILFISETLRKEGDASDPYAILQNMVDSGGLDSYFSELGVRMARLRNQ